MLKFIKSLPSLLLLYIAALIVCTPLAYLAHCFFGDVAMWGVIVAGISVGIIIRTIDKKMNRPY